MKVLDFPLAKITIWFIIGITISYFWQPAIMSAMTLLIASISLFCILYFLPKKNKNLNALFGLSTCFISLCTGLTALLINTDSFQKTNYIHYNEAFEKPHYINLILREKLKSNDYNDRYIAIIKHIDNKAYSGRIIVNFSKDSIKNQLIIGNLIRLKTILQHNSPLKNPNQFDYNKYLSNKQIYGQIYVSKDEISINRKIKKDIWFYTSRLNARIVRNLEKAKFHKAEMNVALALILGQQQEISSDIIQDYQYSGATHVLSVSGLHVGFIMLFILFILKPIPNTQKGSLIKLIAILISLFLFAIISGLSPPVLRSVVMFSFLALGNHLHRNSNTYHTLLVSILLILLFEPYYLFDVGFQLSYIALFSILWLQPLLKQIWAPENKILNYIWEALTVSFAAQIGTFPLCLYYFHQFPGLFFITNILIIPVLSFIMVVGIIVMIISVFTNCPLFLIQIFEKSIYILNQIIHYIAAFKVFVITDISFNLYFLFSFYFLVITATIYLKKPSYNKLIAVFISVILVQISFIFTKKETQSQQEFIVYNAKKKTIITEKKGKDVALFTNDNIAKNSSLNSYLVGNFGILKSVSKTKNVMFFNDKKILLIDSTCIYKNTIEPDILILIQSPKINLDRVLKNLHPKIIIADASNAYLIQKRWKASCLKKNIPFHSTSEKGFYKLN
ncbi:ComEC/Rec2 family competence protein [Flavobacterium aquidurense]|uniref:ComEC/Rec2 family competence protein n=1 Tax=Flavobacterium aquidurense TaxID=362413 RepID=UPI002866C623|nr:ComEC/Rec2 family competence protein [Flavobacterium aquidurense]MDR7369432.1 competence protein ComEC [Flavobacterium aquidurense]